MTEIDQALEWHLFLAARLRMSASQLKTLAIAAETTDIPPGLLRAIMSAEMLARPMPHRLIEFLAFLLAVVVSPSRAARMTLGPAQVRVSSVQATDRPALLRRGIQLMSWSHACRAAAEKVASAGTSNPRDVCKDYNGPACAPNYVNLVTRLSTRWSHTTGWGSV